MKFRFNQRMIINTVNYPLSKYESGVIVNSSVIEEKIQMPFEGAGILCHV